MSRPPFRDGAVHVLAERCATCIFRPGNPMRLHPGRVAGMVEEALSRGSSITCHSTLYREEVDEAVCAGFADRYGDRSTALRLAHALGLTVTVSPPPHERTTDDHR